MRYLCVLQPNSNAAHTPTVVLQAQGPEPSLTGAPVGRGDAGSGSRARRLLGADAQNQSDVSQREGREGTMHRCFANGTDERRYYCHISAVTSVTPIYLQGAGLAWRVSRYSPRATLPPGGLSPGQGERSIYPSARVLGPCALLLFPSLLGNKFLGLKVF